MGYTEKSANGGISGTVSENRNWQVLEHKEKEKEKKMIGTIYRITMLYTLDL